jgi:hypothetical protein
LKRYSTYLPYYIQTLYWFQAKTRRGSFKRFDKWEMDMVEFQRESMAAMNSIRGIRSNSLDGLHPCFDSLNVERYTDAGAQRF